MIFRAFFYISCLLYLSVSSVHVSAKTEYETKTESCLEARSARNESSITEYICPSGDTSLESSLPLTRDRICGSIYVQTDFAKIDQDAMKWAEKLQDTRNTNIESWILDIRKMTEEYRKKYIAVCDISLFQKACNPTGSDVFPETICQDLARQKALAWENMGYILAGQGVAKTYQNDKDTFIDKTKTKYAKIADKWNRYLRIFDTAVSKFTAYIKKAVK